MQAAARIGISMTISQVGSDLPTAGIPATMFPIDRTKDWQPAFTLDEDGVLHQLRATLVQAIDASLRTLLHPVLLIFLPQHLIEWFQLQIFAENFHGSSHYMQQSCP